MNVDELLSERGIADRLRTYEVLETARRDLCTYRGDPCDCKYGLTVASRLIASELRKRRLVAAFVSTDAVVAVVAEVLGWIDDERRTARAALSESAAPGANDG
jgi:hypothetical protein